MSSNSSLTIPTDAPASSASDSDSNSNGPTVTQDGGTTRVQFGKAEDYTDARFANEAVRSGVSNGGAFRMNANGEAEEFGQVTRYQVTDPGYSDDILASAMNPWGTRASSINRETLLTFAPGMTPTPVKVGLTLGWLREDGPGRFVVTGRHVAEIAALMGQQQ
jgi:hypothetical protein